MADGNGLERRTYAECRVESDGRRIKGYAIVFNVKSVNLGGFREIIKPEAVDRTLQEARDVRALVDHDTGKIIGRTRAGTLTLRKDGFGLKVDIDPADTTAGRDILESVRRGDVTGMSFSFRTITDDWHMEDDEHIREVSDMTMDEVSVVAFPAYPQTSVEVAQRSLQAFQATRRGSSIAWLRKIHKTRMAK